MTDTMNMTTNETSARTRLAAMGFPGYGADFATKVLCRMARTRESAPQAIAHLLHKGSW